MILRDFTAPGKNELDQSRVDALASAELRAGVRKAWRCSLKGGIGDDNS